MKQTDTFPQWLQHRYGHAEWEALSDGDQVYWQHEADAVRRAVARNGFKDTPPARKET